MTTTSGARAAAKALLEANVPVDSASAKVPLHWQDENLVVLPDVPQSFVYTEFNVDTAARLVSFEGGAGSKNRYRNYCRINAYVFVPNDRGLSEAESIAEQIATLFRSYGDDNINCAGATVVPNGKDENVKPPGVSFALTNYLWTIAMISLTFDQK